MKRLELLCTNRSQVLHGLCFYDGNCEPEELLITDIRETANYIRDAEGLAQADSNP